MKVVNRSGQVLEQNVEEVIKNGITDMLQTPGEIMMEVASEKAKTLVDEKLLVPEVKEASSQGYIHINDREYYLTKSLSCLQHPLDKVLRYGLKIGAYHYVTARNEEEARRQARFFVSLVSNKEIDCKLAMDYEYFPDLSKDEINKISLAFLQEVENLSGKKVIVYSDAYNANNTFSGEVTKYPLWIAQYGVEKPQNNGNWEVWEGFQYTDVGRVNGIRGNVDRDKYTKDILLEDSSKIPEIEKPEKQKEDIIIYRIERGNTLIGIASRYNTTVRSLVELNHIKNPNLIYAGSKLYISYNFINEDKTTYLVKWGDTLSQIAQNYHTTVDHLVEINKIKNANLIYAGETLII